MVRRLEEDGQKSQRAALRETQGNAVSYNYISKHLSEEEHELVIIMNTIY